MNETEQTQTQTAQAEFQSTQRPMQIPIDITPELPQAATTTTVSVPAEHSGLIERMLALLARGEQWIADNIHAGLANLEKVLSEQDADVNNQEQAGKQ